MKIKNALAANRDQFILFISDPTTGDEFVFGTEEQLEAFPGFNTDNPIRETSDGHEITTAGYLLDTLDFETYDNQSINITRI